MYGGGYDRRGMKGNAPEWGNPRRNYDAPYQHQQRWEGGGGGSNNHYPSDNNPPLESSPQVKKEEPSPSPTTTPSTTTPAPSVKEEKPDIKTVGKSEKKVALDTYNSDLHLTIEKNNPYAAHPLHEKGFAYVWSGARANFGVNSGKIVYEVRLVEHLDVAHLPPEEATPHVLRVGFSTDDTSMQLGEEPDSWGYGGTGKISTCCQFKNYGIPFMQGDCVACFLNMESDPIEISFAVNGKAQGIAYHVPKKQLGSKALFPHILSKNTAYEVNFGQLPQPYYPLPNGYESYIFIDYISDQQKIPGSSPPKPNEKEILMMCGLPGCGKTTWVAEYCAKNPEKKYNVIGTNALIDKMKVMGLARKRNYHGRWDVLIKHSTDCLNHLMKMAGGVDRNFILDQTNVYPSAQRRKMKQFEGFKKKAIVIVPTEEEFKRRCDKRDREEGKEIPDSAVLEMKANFALPEEGSIFDQIIFTDLQREEAEPLVRQYNEEGRGATGPSAKRFRPDNEPFRGSRGRGFRGGRGFEGGASSWMESGREGPESFDGNRGWRGGFRGGRGGGGFGDRSEGFGNRDGPPNFGPGGFGGPGERDGGFGGRGRDGGFRGRDGGYGGRDGGGGYGGRDGGTGGGYGGRDGGTGGGYGGRDGNFRGSGRGGGFGGGRDFGGSNFAERDSGFGRREGGFGGRDGGGRDRGERSGGPGGRDGPRGRDGGYGNTGRDFEPRSGPDFERGRDFRKDRTGDGPPDFKRDEDQRGDYDRGDRNRGDYGKNRNEYGRGRDFRGGRGGDYRGRGGVRRDFSGGRGSNYGGSQDDFGGRSRDNREYGNDSSYSQGPQSASPAPQPPQYGSGGGTQDYSNTPSSQQQAYSGSSTYSQPPPAQSYNAPPPPAATGNTYGRDQQSYGQKDTYSSGYGSADATDYNRNSAGGYSTTSGVTSSYSRPYNSGDQSYNKPAQDYNRGNVGAPTYQDYSQSSTTPSTLQDYKNKPPPNFGKDNSTSYGGMTATPQSGGSYQGGYGGAYSTTNTAAYGQQNYGSTPTNPAAGYQTSTGTYSKYETTPSADRSSTASTNPTSRYNAPPPMQQQGYSYSSSVPPPKYGGDSKSSADYYKTSSTTPGYETKTDAYSTTSTAAAAVSQWGSYAAAPPPPPPPPTSANDKQAVPATNQQTPDTSMQNPYGSYGSWQQGYYAGYATSQTPMWGTTGSAVGGAVPAPTGGYATGTAPSSTSTK